MGQLASAIETVWNVPSCKKAHAIDHESLLRAPPDTAYDIVCKVYREDILLSTLLTVLEERRETQRDQSLSL